MIVHFAKIQLKQRYRSWMEVPSVLVRFKRNTHAFLSIHDWHSNYRLCTIYLCLVSTWYIFFNFMCDLYNFLQRVWIGVWLKSQKICFIQLLTNILQKDIRFTCVQGDKNQKSVQKTVQEFPEDDRRKSIDWYLHGFKHVECLRPPFCMKTCDVLLCCDRAVLITAYIFRRQCYSS